MSSKDFCFFVSFSWDKREHINKKAGKKARLKKAHSQIGKIKTKGETQWTRINQLKLPMYLREQARIN